MNVSESDAKPRDIVTPHERALRATRARDGKNRVRTKGHPTTSEIDYTREEIEFMAAVEAFKNSTGRQFPTWREVHRIMKSLGYSR